MTIATILRAYRRAHPRCRARSLTPIDANGERRSYRCLLCGASGLGPHWSRAPQTDRSRDELSAHLEACPEIRRAVAAGSIGEAVAAMARYGARP